MLLGNLKGKKNQQDIVTGLEMIERKVSMTVPVFVFFSAQRFLFIHNIGKVI